jgi:hypothetical protein
MFVVVVLPKICDPLVEFRTIEHVHIAIGMSYICQDLEHCSFYCP